MDHQNSKILTHKLALQNHRLTKVNHHIGQQEAGIVGEQWEAGKDCHRRVTSLTCSLGMDSIHLC